MKNAGVKGRHKNSNFLSRCGPRPSMIAASSALSPLAGGAQPNVAFTPSLNQPISVEAATVEDYETLPVAKLLPLLSKVMDSPQELPAVLPLG